MLNTQNIKEAIKNLSKVDVEKFSGSGGFKFFVNQLHVESFRHIDNLKIDFTHPVTLLTGTNAIGKTSVLLLIACSHYEFLRIDSTKPITVYRRHTWRDVLPFTKYENTTRDYGYKLNWRVANKITPGSAKRLTTSQAWTGIGKYSADKKRKNTQIRERQVRFVDLERVLPARNFSASLMKKTVTATQTRLSEDVEKAFAYILELAASPLIYDIGSHINKSAYLIDKGSNPYSSYNAASGEETLINILKEIIGSPVYSLILIDEIEACLHPNVQRRLADIIQYVSWNQQKQFIITTHSPTLLSAFPQACRKFIDKDPAGNYEVIPNISVAAAFSKMDAKEYPLITLYCEDDLAEFMIKNVMVDISAERKYFNRLVNIVRSGPVNEVKTDYDRHERNYVQLKHKMGYACVFDGDYKDKSPYSEYFEHPNRFSHFFSPYVAPEKFLVAAYLREFPNESLSSELAFGDHHYLFKKMENMGLATDEKDARGKCWEAFKKTEDYKVFFSSLKEFLLKVVKHFSAQAD